MSFWNKIFPPRAEPELHPPSAAAMIDYQPQPWTPDAREYVQSLQERKYRELAKAHGLGEDLAEVHRRLTPPQMPLGHITYEKFWAAFREAFPGTDEEFRAIFDNNMAAYKPYFEMVLPTPYEDPNHYSLLAMTFDSVAAAVMQKSRTVTIRAQALFATLPSGDVSAGIFEEPETDTPIILFERALFTYLYGFSKICGWALPPIELKEMSSDAYLAGLPRIYTMPFGSSVWFGGLLRAYIISGGVNDASASMPNPEHNSHLTEQLLDFMKRFIMAHELSHISLGHLERPASNSDEAKQREFEADANAFAIVTQLSAKQTGSWATGAWACYMALTALHFLDRGMALLSFGTTNVNWVSESHPDALLRRDRFRPLAYANAPKPRKITRNATGSLFNMSDSLLGRLWEMTLPLMFKSYQDGARPSPMWSQRIARSMRLSAIPPVAN